VDDLLTDFIAETRETLEALAGEIVAWEADPADKTRLDAIFRFVHTVKGSCGFLDLPRLGKLSHAAEDCLAEVRSGTRTPDAALVSAVLAIIDRIGELTDALEANETLPEGEDEFLIAALARGTATPAAENPAAVSKISVMPTNAPIRTVSRSIRLPVELLDRMMAGVSDMVLARNELSRLLRAGGAIAPPTSRSSVSRSVSAKCAMRSRARAWRGSRPCSRPCRGWCAIWQGSSARQSSSRWTAATSNSTAR